MVDQWGNIVCENCGSEEVVTDGNFSACTVCGRSVTTNEYDEESDTESKCS